MNEQMMSDPRIQQAVQEAVAGLADNEDLNPRVIASMIRMFEYVLQHPEAYPELLQSAMQSGAMEPGDMPEEFDETLVAIVLMALKMLQQQGGQREEQDIPAFACGGLNRIAAQGRRGDSQLAHINPFEARLLESYGASGGINPRTGLQEFGFLSKVWKGVKSVVKAVTPIAAVFVAPYLAPALGGGLMGAMGAGAITGGLSATITGDNIGRGALMGGLGGGLTGGLGETIGGYLAPSLSGTTQQLIGSGLVGGLSGMANGQGFAQGAVGSALGNYLGKQVSGMGGAGALGAGVRQGGQTLGNLLTLGVNPRQALLGGALAGVATGMGYGPGQKPSEIATAAAPTTQDVASSLPTFDPTTGQMVNTAAATMPAFDPTTGQMAGAGQAAGAPADSGFGLNAKTAGLGLSLMSMMGSAKTPQEVQQATQTMSPEQKEYFNRVAPTWDWNQLQAEASKRGMGLGQYIASDWNTLSAPAYNIPKKLAMGGLSMLAQGGGSGRDDTIDARLSDGEYVFDAETTALLGDGSVKEGARRLDQMRERIRQHKGKSLSRGKISPNAKSPLAYLKGAA